MSVTRKNLGYYISAARTTASLNINYKQKECRPTSFMSKVFYNSCFISHLPWWIWESVAIWALFTPQTKTIPPNAQSLIWIIKHGNNYVPRNEKTNKLDDGLYTSIPKHTRVKCLSIFFLRTLHAAKPARKSKLNKRRWKTIREIFNILCVFFFHDIEKETAGLFRVRSGASKGCGHKYVLRHPFAIKHEGSLIYFR